METPNLDRALEPLRRALEEAWSGETSAAADWSPEVPARGQCAVSALVIQDDVGGDLVRATVGGSSHYWNRLPDGDDVDLTRSQFQMFEPADVAVASRDYILSFPETKRRYLLLRRRLAERLPQRA